MGQLATKFMDNAAVTLPKLALPVISSLKITTYPILTTDNILQYDCSAGSFVTTLPTAVGATGKTYTLIRINQTASVEVTINTTSGQTMGGIASGGIALDIQRESISFISDGANWQILYWNIPQIQYSLTVAGTNWTTARAVALITKTQSATPVWRANIDVGGNVSVASANIVLTVTGLAFALGGPNNRQSVYSSDDAFGGAPSNPFASGSTLQLNFAAPTTGLTCGATLELASKPTFAM